MNNKKYNRKQGLLVRFGLNPLGILSIPVNDLVRKLEPYKASSESVEHWATRFREHHRTEYSNIQYYTDKTFTFSHSYNIHLKKFVYCLESSCHDKKFYEIDIKKGFFRIGDNLDVEKINSIMTNNYKIDFTIKISMFRGYVDLLVKDLLTDNVIYQEQECYFNSITKQGLEKEIQKYIFSKLGY